MRRREEEPEMRVLEEISSMIVNIVRSPPPLVTHPYRVTYSCTETPSTSSQIRLNTSPWRMSPATFASLFIGISVALMLFGSIIFFIGLILMPWIIGLVLIFYLAGILSTLLGFGRAFLSWAVSPPHFPAWKFM